MNSSSVGGGVKRVIAKSVKKTIEDIKEITGCDEDEIYSMLQECNMDPNETTQNLLSLDPFHEVKRKRDRKKENPTKESTEPRWKPRMQGRGNRGGRRSFPSRHISHEAGTSRNAHSAKDSEIKKSAVDGVIQPVPQYKNKETPVVARSSNQSEVTATTASSKLEGPLQQVPCEANKIPTAVLSASDPILVPSQDSRLSVGAIRREVGTQLTPVEQAKETPAEINSASAVAESSFVQGKMVEEEGNNLASESSGSAPSSHVSSSVVRPSSNYNNRGHQAIGPQKVGPGKEWKPKPTNHIHAQGLATEVPTIPAEDHSSLKPEFGNPDSKERKVERSHISDGQHVIIPNHLQVPEVEKLGFQFGSFDASFGVSSSLLSGAMSVKSPSPSEASEEIAEHIEQTTRNQDVLVKSDDGDFSDRPPSSSNAPRNLSPEGDFSSDVAPEPTESKHEAAHPTPGHQYPVLRPSSSLNFGFVPPIIGSHIAPFENNEPPRDASRVPSFVVQQPFDPADYYRQFYCSGTGSDGRISPFHPPAMATKYNGNIPVVSSMASQSYQEVGNPLILSAAGPTPLATQAGGVMQTSIAVTQQQVPVFRQPTGLHLPHYPPNYIPYGPHFSPFYLPPTAIHQFLSNGAFPPQPEPGVMYPAPQVATLEYPHLQYKSGSNTANSGHIVVSGIYGPYGSSPTGYNPNPAVTAGNSTSNEDLGGSQLKESNGYVTGQQCEGSGVWIAAPGQDISALQASSFYNLPQGGQLAYTPAQAAHGTFINMCHHPPQPVITGPIHPLHQQPQSMAGGVDMVGPTSSMYQQQPRQPTTRINWPSNY